MNQKQHRDELLSAYLDGELSAERQTRLKAQLATSPALQAEFEALRRTIALVGDLPEVATPRNFILPRAAMGVAPSERSSVLRRAWFAPLLTAATSVVSILFIVVLAGDLLWVRANRLAFVPAPAREAAAEIAPAELAVEAAVMEEAEAEEAVLSQEAPVAAADAEPYVEATAVAEKVVVVEDVEASEDAAQMEEGRALEPAPAPVGVEAFEVPVATDVAGAMAELGEVDTEQAPMGGGQVAPTETSTDATELVEPEDDLEPTPAEMAEAVLPVDEEEQTAAAPRLVPPVDEGSTGAPGAFLRRVTALILGLVSLTLSGATVWAWLARRR